MASSFVTQPNSTTANCGLDHHGNFSIVAAKPEDAPILGSLIQELADFERMPDGPKITAEQLAADLKEGAACAMLAYHIEANEVAGMTIYYQAYSTWVGKYIHLEDLYVREKFRRQGLAARLLAEVVKVARDKGMKRVQWNVLEWNKNALNLYKKLNAVDFTEKEGWHTCRLGLDQMEAIAKGGVWQPRID